MKWHVLLPGTKLPPSIKLDGRQHILRVDPSNRSSQHYCRNNFQDEILNTLGVPATAHALDFWHIACAVYTADRCILRKWCIDAWTREFELFVPVSSPQRWNTAKTTLEDALHFLTGDQWRIRFSKRPPLRAQSVQRMLFEPHATALYSGGLDSLVGVLDLLSAGEDVALVSHHGGGITKRIQDDVLTEIAASYPDSFRSFAFFLYPPKTRTPKETTMRSRSIVFLALGAAVDDALAHSRRLVVAENGLISLNVPLTPARGGSLSTRTTHPHFMSLIQEALEIVGFETNVERPYQFVTKGEMLSQCRDQECLASSIDWTMSCAHPESGRYRKRSPRMHCGYCVPCIIRRAALLKAGYEDDPIQKRPRRSSRRWPTGATGLDVRAWRIAASRTRRMSLSQTAMHLLSTGPLPSELLPKYAKVYRRGVREVQLFLDEIAT